MIILYYLAIMPDSISERILKIGLLVSEFIQLQTKIQMFSLYNISIDKPCIKMILFCFQDFLL